VAIKAVLFCLLKRTGRSNEWPTEPKGEVMKNHRFNRLVTAGATGLASLVLVAAVPAASASAATNSTSITHNCGANLVPDKAIPSTNLLRRLTSAGDRPDAGRAMRTVPTGSEHEVRTPSG
jgi:hypothetical protein